ncbi:MAG: hypothetical protein NTZ72_19535 [Afipia sp.]|nr:hypothetical protein [Afipia sp.]
MPVTLEYCGLDRADQLMAFFRNQWSETHILGNSIEPLDWQHRNEAENRYNFLIAVAENDIVGMLGFIPAARYDASLSTALNTLWLTTWKVRADYAHGLGVHLLRSLTLKHPHAWIGTVGLNSSTRGIYELFGYKTGVLPRYFLLNERVDSFRLAAVPDNFGRPKVSSNTTTFSILDEDNFLAVTDGLISEMPNQVPAKTARHLYNRYLKHPFYRYQALLVRDQNATAILIVRRCDHAGTCALRIVDFLGTPDVIAGAADALQQLLQETKAEYLDFYCTGLDAELKVAGLSCQSDVSGLILPGHFEPFEKQNVELLYALKGPEGRMIICKGDADQDRPNSLPLKRRAE